MLQTVHRDPLSVHRGMSVYLIFTYVIRFLTALMEVMKQTFAVRNAYLHQITLLINRLQLIVKLKLCIRIVVQACIRVLHENCW